MSFATVLAEDRRLVILRMLTEAQGFEANETVLKLGLDRFLHHVGRDILRADIQYLTDHQLVRIEKMKVAAGDLWLVTLTASGEDVARGRLHPGVARLSPEG